MSQKTHNIKTAMIMAGGTGGHIFPGLAVAHKLQENGWRVIWLGAAGGMETRLVPKHGFDLYSVHISGVRGKGLKRKVKLPFMLGKAFFEGYKIIKKEKPDIAIGFGGYAAFPVAVITRLFGKPLIIHEQNAVLGLTNKLLSSIANRTLCGFPGVFPSFNDYIGNPVRQDIMELPEPRSRFTCRQGPLRILVIGGSLGAGILNEVVPKALALMKHDLRPYVVQQAGSKHIEQLKKNYQQEAVEADCRGFIDDMAKEYEQADLVVCRAGALTIAELATSGVGSVLIPLPIAVDDHQTKNAEFLSKQSAGVLIPQTAFTPEWFAEFLSQLTREKCLEMAVAARQQAVVNAAGQVAAICEEIYDKH